MIKQIINKPWLLTNEIRMALNLPISLITLIINKVKITPPFRFYGSPTILRHRKSKIIIGKNFENRNWFNSNPLGISHPTILSTLSSNAEIRIGDHVGISGGSIVSASRIEIGDFTMIGSNCEIIDTDFHALSPQNRRYSKKNITSKPIKIGKNVFIGTNSIILHGVNIGDNSIIGAGSIVRKNIPANCIFVEGKIKKQTKG